MRHPRWFLLGAALVALAQIGTLTWMIAGRAAILREGPVIVLAVQPVDPRDFLRGDYMRLNYNISRIDQSLFVDDKLEDLPHDISVFVRLSEDDEGIWQVERATLDRPPEEGLPEGDVILRGNLRYMAGESAVVLNYGIERYYVPQGEGRPFEAPDMANDLRAHIAIGPDGSAQIKSLHHGERMLFSEPIF